jgi:hypothetical protein
MEVRQGVVIGYRLLYRFGIVRTYSQNSDIIDFPLLAKGVFKYSKRFIKPCRISQWAVLTWKFYAQKANGIAPLYAIFISSGA